jgi:hypothetical protein
LGRLLPDRQRIHIEATLQAVKNALPEQIVDAMAGLPCVNRIKISLTGPSLFYK